MELAALCTMNSKCVRKLKNIVVFRVELILDSSLTRKLDCKFGERRRLLLTAPRRWFRLAFCLRTLFVVVTIFGVCVGGNLQIVRERKAVLQALRAESGDSLELIYWSIEAAEGAAPIRTTLWISLLGRFCRLLRVGLSRTWFRVGFGCTNLLRRVFIAGYK